MLRRCIRLSATLTHVTPSGLPSMVDVTHKTMTSRVACATALVYIPPDVVTALLGANVTDSSVPNELISAKGAVFGTAVCAGTLAAKLTPTLIPFCHSLPLSDVSLKASCELLPQRSPAQGDAVAALATLHCLVRTKAGTGVEMEALTAVSVAALTVYDMLKGAQRSPVSSAESVSGGAAASSTFTMRLGESLRILNTHLVFKSGGKSGTVGSLPSIFESTPDEMC